MDVFLLMWWLMTTLALYLFLENQRDFDTNEHKTNFGSLVTPERLHTREFYSYLL